MKRSTEAGYQTYLGAELARRRRQRLDEREAVFDRILKLNDERYMSRLLTSENYAEISNGEYYSSDKANERVLGILKARKIKKRYKEGRKYRRVKRIKNIYPLAEFEDLNRFNALYNKKDIKYSICFGQPTEWELWKGGIREKLHVMKKEYGVFTTVLSFLIAWLIWAALTVSVFFIIKSARLDVAIAFAAAGITVLLGLMAVPFILNVFYGRRIKNMQYDRGLFRLFQLYKMEANENWFQFDFGTQWTRDNPMPNGASFHDALYEWEKRRRKEDTEYFDCTENTEWARNNPDLSEYSYLKALKLKKWQSLAGRRGKKNRRYVFENNGMYMEKYTKRFLAKKGYFSIEYGCGDLYGHFLWLERRIKYDKEFRDMMCGLKKSPFVYLASDSDWTRSLSLYKSYEKAKIKVEEKELWRNFTKRHDDMERRQA